MLALQLYLLVLAGGLVEQLHQLAGLDGVVYGGAGLYLLGRVGQEVAHLAGVHVLGGVVVLGLGQHAVAGGVQREAAAVLQAYASLVADEIDKGIVLADVLRPGALQRYGGYLALVLKTHETGYVLLHIVGAVADARAGPHGLADVLVYVAAQHGVGLGGHALELALAHAVEYQVEVVNAPVDEHAAARLGLDGERSAQAGYGAMRAEGAVYMIYIAQNALLDEIMYIHNGVVEAVANADGEHVASLVGGLLHLGGLVQVYGSGLLAQHLSAGL